MNLDWKASGRKLLREPLVHFLVAGAAVFWVLSGRPPDLGERRIVVGPEAVGSLVQRFDDSFHRMPTQDEIDGMIRNYVADQVYYREALRLGLDKDDEVVVKRMRRKMESLAVADAEVATPSDAELQALLDKDPARYAANPETTFDQVYLGADNPATRAEVGPMLVKLRNGEKVEGTPAPLAAHMDAAGSDDIAGAFGDEFASSIDELPLGQWSGPVASGLGLHLVRVTKRIAPKPPILAKVRQRVENDWRSAAVKRAEAEAYNRILKGYDVVIDLPQQTSK